VSDHQWLASHGWEMDETREPCWLDHEEEVPPGFRREWTDSHGDTWEIFLCVTDAVLLEKRAYQGDYRGALTPEDSRARTWPWVRVEPCRTVAGL
jgi:hypothetical protein